MAETIGLMLLLMLVTFFLEIIIAILLSIASIRFARSRKISEVFRFGSIIGYIGKIGWLTYILAFLKILICIGVPLFILEMIFSLRASSPDIYSSRLVSSSS